MKLIINVLFLFVLLFLLILKSNVCAVETASSSATNRDDEIIVKLKNGSAKNNLHSIALTLQAIIQKELLFDNTFVLKVPQGSINNAVKSLSENPEVMMAEPNYQTNKIIIDEEKASASAKIIQNLSNKISPLTIAILDTGIKKSSNYLKEKIAYEKNFTTSLTVNDENGHGTELASRALEATSSAILMNIKVLDDNGYGSYAEAINGIVEAANNHADIVYIGFSLDQKSEFLNSALSYASAKSTTFILPDENLKNSSPTPVITEALNGAPEIPPVPLPLVKNTQHIITPSETINKITISKIEVSYEKKNELTDLFAKIYVVKIPDNSVINSADVSLDVVTPSGKMFDGTAQTNKNGYITFALRNIKEKGIYKINVTSVTKKSHIYSPTTTKYSLEIK